MYATDHKWVWPFWIVLSAVVFPILLADLAGAQSDERILDVVADAAAAFDTDRLRADYDGPVLVIRRSSDDSLLSVGTVGETFNHAAYESFVGNGQAFVATFYDQSGHAADASQLTPLRQPRLVPGPVGQYLLATDGARGLGIPGLYDRISGAEALTVFVVAEWDGTPSDGPIYLLTAGRYRPAAGLYPLSMFLHWANGGQAAPIAQANLSDGRRISLRALGVLGRANVREIYELVFDKDRRIALYSSGRVVDEVDPDGEPLLSSDPYNEGVFLATDGNFADGLTGMMAPPLIYDRALSEEERESVRSWLATRYEVDLPRDYPPGDDEFTIVFIPDTQRYAAEILGARAQVMQDAFEWIAANRVRWNIQLVLHAGDVVNTARNNHEWEAAESWYDQIETAEIPYAVAVGNHDYDQPLENRLSARFNGSFPTHSFADAAWWSEGGFLEPGKSDNLYFTLEMGGEDYLVLTMEFQPRRQVLEWARGVLMDHADKKAIVLTHDFMNEIGVFDTTTYAIPDAVDSQTLYEDLIATHNNIFLVLSGHHARGTSRKKEDGTGAHFLYFDPMELDWGNQGLIRLLVVSPRKGTIRVMTYSPSDDLYRGDFLNLFTLDAEPATKSLNARPMITAIQGVSIDEDSSTGPISFQVFDAETYPDGLTVTATSDDQSLVPDANIVLAGSGIDRTITLAPRPDSSGGPVTVTVEVDDGEKTAATQFRLSIAGVNDEPAIVSAPDLTAEVGKLFEHEVRIHDPDPDDVVSIEAESLPAWLDLDRSDHGAAVLRGMPGYSDSGLHRFSISATDSTGARAEQTATVLVGDSLSLRFVLIAKEQIVVESPQRTQGHIFSNGIVHFTDGGPGEHAGDVYAVGDLSVGAQNTIVGRIVSGGSVDIHTTSVVSGGWSEFQSVAAAPLPVVDLIEPGEQDVLVKTAELVSLPPGAYGELMVQSKGTLSLREGNYAFKRIQVQRRGTVTVDVRGGIVVALVRDKIEFGSDSRLIVAPDSNTTRAVFMSGSQNEVILGRQSIVMGTIVAPDGLVTIEPQVQFKGVTMAREIQVFEAVFVSHSGKILVVPVGTEEGQAEDDRWNEDIRTSATVLHQNYPNPFVGRTRISYALSEPNFVTLSVYDVLGRVIHTLVDTRKPAGRHVVDFDGRDLPAGIYLYRLETESAEVGRSMALLR